MSKLSYEQLEPYMRDGHLPDCPHHSAPLDVCLCVHTRMLEHIILQRDALTDIYQLYRTSGGWDASKLRAMADVATEAKKPYTARKDPNA